MAKITLGKLSSNLTIQGMQELLKKEIPLKTAWKVKGLTKKFNEELKKYNELRKEVLDRYAQKDEDGKPKPDEKGNYIFPPECLQDLSKSMQELSEIETEFDPIKVDELGDIKIKGEELLNLGEIIDG